MSDAVIYEKRFNENKLVFDNSVKMQAMNQLLPPSTPVLLTLYFSVGYGLKFINVWSTAMWPQIM